MRYLDRVSTVAAKALEHGATFDTWRDGAPTRRIRWQCSGNCSEPVTVELYGRKSADHRNPDRIMAEIFKKFPGATVTSDTRGDNRPRGIPKHVTQRPGEAGKPLTVEMEVRCRRCDNCRRWTSWQWTKRALAEYSAAHRTWFGTLTLSPTAHTNALAKARRRLDAQGIDFDALPLVEQFALRHREICPEITRYLKRVRKESGARLRYLLVAEAHKSGLPHYHMLILEMTLSDQVRHRTLSDQWLLGFSNWKLANDRRAATYLCKYIAKSASARVRASIGFGNATPLGIATDDDSRASRGTAKQESGGQVA